MYKAESSTPAKYAVTKSASSARDTTAGELRLDNILGLRCLSIVLSFLGECDGTSFLLCQKLYWTDTILTQLRIPAPRTKNDLDTKSAEDADRFKYRHKMSDRANNPLVRIPDASTRLDRLNTRRWHARRPSTNPRGKQTCGLLTSQLAQSEWNQIRDFSEDEATVNIDSCDVTREGNFRWLMNPPLLRFYQGESMPCSNIPYFKDGITCLASYPRSGNTLLRSLLEAVTGFCTSSDTRPDRTLSIALAEKPPFFCGEGLAPTSIGSSSPFLPPQLDSGNRLLSPPPICKTHWPERIGCQTYDCHRVILLVRNPFDATDSYWHMSLTNTHTEKVIPSVTEAHKEFYNGLVRHEILQVWMGFLDFYWKECSRRNIPLLMVRYEDLLLHPRRELQRILEFSCNKNESNGEAWWKKRLEEVTRQEDSTLPSPSSTEKCKYGYRSLGDVSSTKETMPTAPTTQGGSSHPSIGRSIRNGNFSLGILNTVHELDDNRWLQRLGYDIFSQGFPDNLASLPPVPVLKYDSGDDVTNHGLLTMNVKDVSLELRPRDSPYGRNMTHWRRQRTAKDTQPFPTK